MSNRKQASGKGVDCAGDTISIGRHVFMNAVRVRVEDGSYSQEQAEPLEWLWGYAFNELGGSRSRLCEAVGYDWSVIYKVFTGSYEAGIDRFCEAIEHLRETASSSRTGFVPTLVTEKIFRTLDFARDSSSIVLVSGPTGRSKTSSLREWARGGNQGRCPYVRCISNSTRRLFVRQICHAVGIGISGKKTTELEERLLRSFSWRHTLLIDEVGHILPREGRGGTSAVEFLRDLHDTCGCGIALVMTRTGLDELTNGRYARYFEQFVGRIKDTVIIPEDVFPGEAAAVCSAFTENVTESLVRLAHRIASDNDGRLRTLFDDLRRAEAVAGEMGEALSDKHLAQVVQIRKRGGLWDDTWHRK